MTSAHIATRVAILAIALISQANSHAIVLPTIENGSLTGPAGAATLPDGWTRVPGTTPDTVDVDGPFNNTDILWTLSPDGGTFVRSIGSSNSEAFEQTVSGFTVGDAYTLDFFQTNLGWENLTGTQFFNTAGYWGLFADDILVGQSTVMAGPVTAGTPNQWWLDSLTFIATDSTLTLRLQAFTTLPGSGDDFEAYLGIDGLQLRAIPLPAAVWLLGSAVLGLVGLRTKTATTTS